jgi:hypothetical protein
MESGMGFFVKSAGVVARAFSRRFLLRPGSSFALQSGFPGREPGFSIIRIFNKINNILIALLN